MSGERHFADFKMLASAGLLKGISPLFKFGANPSVSTGTVPEDIISLGGIKLFPTAASTISIVSDSASDAPGGTGINTVVIHGLDSSYNQISETVTLNGLTPVVTTLEFFRVMRLYGTQAGSNQKAVGNIIATHNEGDISEILADYGQSLDASYTVPANHLLLIDRMKASLERTAAGAGAEIHIEMMFFGQTVWREQGSLSISASGTSFAERNTDLWFPVPEKTDLRIHVESVETNNTSIAAAFDALLIDLDEFSFN